MRKPLSQIPLDFGGEEKDPSPARDANDNTGQQEGKYLATSGVGVRIKAYKKPAPPAAANAELFQPPSPGNVSPEPAAPDAPLQPAEPVEPMAPIAALTVLPPEPDPVSTLSPPASGPATEKRPSTLAMPQHPSAPAAATTKRPATTLPSGPSKRGRKSLKQVTAEADLIEVPADDVLFGKQYYTMGEVSAMFKVNQSLLRYWETEFDILQPRKNKKGDRYFRPVDIKNLHLIYHLLRQKKYTIEGAKDFLRHNKKAKERFEIIERLQQIRNFLQEWKAQL